ncbi:MAG: hypothetical protein MRJ68_21080 [Nitrospira sp.]|nr:hypothetical protein [Nitrospira sp.]
MKRTFAAVIILSLTALLGSPAEAQEEQADAATQDHSLAEFSEADINFAAGVWPAPQRWSARYFSPAVST